MKINTIGFKSAIIYTSLSVLVSGIFFVVTLLGNYNWVTRIGGSFWIFMLSMIILMPSVTSLVKKRHRDN
ncbi:MAG: hypothetical protein M1308_04770 [Actinobacteria bacterium]|nr:hypothetical protein [Actinomycetota bacterium]